MVQLGPWGASKVGGVQPGWPWVVGQVQVTRWCHLRREGSGKMAQGLPGGIVPSPPRPPPLSPALTWPGRQEADFSGVSRLLGMSDW